ncbi:alkaline protease [Myriangium duriaei CBS 260.36]|uniref:Alkaline protease n=1 Tax=Myriangium duriaei CBS 260.36 TaxID=1168546 RepID=A0A9P4J3N0_9PEZI|nr:alkaline protease [Myriangium duriaei CBS 260.36]
MSMLQSLHVESQHERNDTQDFSGITHSFKLGKFQAYAAQLAESVASKLKHHSEVADIESDQIWTTSHMQRLVTWGLHRISHRDFHDPRTYYYDKSAGQGTFGYIVDSGVRTTHNEIEGRVSLGYNAFGVMPFVDDSGHGTHNAATMCGTTFGVAKNCTLIAVKIYRKDKTTLATVLDGYEWAVKDVLEKRRQAKAVIFLSASGSFSNSMNKVIDSAFQLGITTIVAAGNDGANTRNVSPASAKGAITTASVNFVRRRSKNSNFGPDVDIFAPGSTILGASSSCDNGKTIMSGTSMAAAFASGLALYFKGMRDLFDAEATRFFMLRVATVGVVGDPAGSRNIFAYNDSGR